MNFIAAILLGLIQGLTEFLPVSSSGHLVIAQSLIPGFSQPGVLFDVVLHAGTLVAVAIYYWKSVLAIEKKYLVLILLASIPAGIFGVLFDDLFESLFSSPKIVGVALLFTALINYLTHTSQNKSTNLNFKNSLLIGIAQAIAIIPGISRSGSTIMAAARQGVDPVEAAKFSFLLSIPAVGGAVLIQLVKYGLPLDDNFSTYALGFSAAVVSGLLAIKIVLKLLAGKKFIYFSYYTTLVGLAALFFL